MARKSKKTEAVPVVDGVLSSKVVALIESLRTPFEAFTEGFSKLTTARSDLAPKFMKAFESWQKETEGSFVGFVRVLDPTVPLDRDGYRRHTSYQVADYLRRKQANEGREETDTVAPEDRPATPLMALARLVATVMPAVDPSGSIWSAFVREMNWSASMADRVKVMAAKEGAVALPPRTKHTLLQRVA